MNPVMIQNVTEFLRNLPAFESLEEESLRQIASGISTEFYPKGRLILLQDGIPSECLRIIQKGAVKQVFITFCLPGT